MGRGSRVSSSFLVLTLAIVMAGLDCERHHYYRVYDPYYTDYHVWDDNEAVYYRQWLNERHRDPDRDFRKLPPEEQKEYWTWRHSHGEHNHERNRDHRDQDHR